MKKSRILRLHTSVQRREDSSHSIRTYVVTYATMVCPFWADNKALLLLLDLRSVSTWTASTLDPA